MPPLEIVPVAARRHHPRRRRLLNRRASAAARASRLDRILKLLAAQSVAAQSRRRALRRRLSRRRLQWRHPQPSAAAMLLARQRADPLPCRTVDKTDEHEPPATSTAACGKRAREGESRSGGGAGSAAPTKVPEFCLLLLVDLLASTSLVMALLRLSCPAVRPAERAYGDAMRSLARARGQHGEQLRERLESARSSPARADPKFWTLRPPPVVRNSARALASNSALAQRRVLLSQSHAPTSGRSSSTRGTRAGRSSS